MNAALRPILISTILISLFSLSYSQSSSCEKYKFEGGKTFARCNDLPYLNSYIHYTYNVSGSSVELAYRHTEITKTDTWVAWAFNTEQAVMIFGQAFVALLRGEGSINPYTTILSNYQPNMLPNDLLTRTWNLSATYANNEIVIFASMQLPYNNTKIYHLWQDGPIRDGFPIGHDLGTSNRLSKGSLDFATGRMTMNNTIPNNSENHKRDLHATLSVVSWGIMMPIGIILARCVKIFEAGETICIYIHIGWQMTAYIIGVTGWVIGLQLGSNTKRTRDLTHRSLGILLFCLATLQVLVMFLRPKKDNNYRHYWNIYHKLIGYTILIITLMNSIKGFLILSPDQKWMTEYFSSIFAIFLIAIFLEIYTRNLIEKRNQMIGVIKLSPSVHGNNGLDGYEGRDRYGLS